MCRRNLGGKHSNKHIWKQREIRTKAHYAVKWETAWYHKPNGSRREWGKGRGREFFTHDITGWLVRKLIHAVNGGCPVSCVFFEHNARTPEGDDLGLRWLKKQGGWVCAEHSFVVCVSRRTAFRSGVGCAECSCASKDACKKVMCRVRRLTSPQAVQRNIMCLYDWTSQG